jgi:hypothetical protein
MTMKIGLLSALIVFLLIVTYNWGYKCGEQSVYSQLFDQSLMSISSNIIIYDFIENYSANDSKPLILAARIESDISKIAHLYNLYHFSFSEIGRCAITRRVRNLAKQKAIFLDKMQLAENGYPIDEVVSYLEKECPGEPSKENWAK